MASDFQQINDYNFNIDSFVQGNNGAVLRFNVRRKGNIVPIDNATVNVAIKRGNDLITKNATIISAPGGICEVILTRADLETAGTYYLQPTIIFPDDDEFSGDVQKFVVSGKLTGAPTNPGNGGTNPVFTVRDSAINGNIIINGAETVVYDDTSVNNQLADIATLNDHKISYTYYTDGNVQTVTEKDSANNVIKTTTYNYNTSGDVSNSVTVMNGKTITTTYIYDPTTGNITNTNNVIS